jgi:hypothetical protein
LGKLPFVVVPKRESAGYGKEGNSLVLGPEMGSDAERGILGVGKTLVCRPGGAGVLN